MSEPTWTRTALLASYFASCRAGIRAEALILNAASLAGLLLHEHGDAHNAIDACRKMPMGAPWARAAELLAELVDAEDGDAVADTVPPMNVAEGEGLR